jgi:hypothetical protein
VRANECNVMNTAQVYNPVDSVQEYTNIPKELYWPRVIANVENARHFLNLGARCPLARDPKAGNELIDEIKALFGRVRAANEPDDLLRK